MSPRAASRLESIGFAQVYDYVAGKADWGSFGLPLEGTCIVVGDARVVLGRLGRLALASDDDVAVEGAMTAGPSTVRPSIALEAIVERMHEQKLTSALVTRSDGTLVGVLRRANAEAAR